MSRLPSGIKRGITTVEDLRERSVQDPVTHCWVWQGGTSCGQASMWAFDHARGEKRVLPGPLAAWNIAHGEAPRNGWIVFAGCSNKLCVNPTHMRQVGSRAEFGEFQRRSGWLCGVALQQKAAALKKARAARGIVDTPKDVVRKVLEMPDLPGVEVARLLGIKVGRVYDIRGGRTRAEAA